jgi:class 3 adenylate cyclase
MAQPIERAAEQIQRIRSLTLDAPERERSRVREIARLQGAVSLLHNALRSFSVFVPVDLVRDLIDSGKPLAPSVEQRFMTVFFSDLENSSTIAETLSPEEFSRQVTMYFESVTEAIALERGTVDKFIGDSVMAFWGAPAPCEDHVWLGCRAALRASNRMRRMNEQWRTEGRPTMRLRVGLHCANVVVGNIGAAQRLSYTVMGDGVNVASRLEGVNKQFGTAICISDSVHEQVAERALVRPIQRLSVKGRVGKFIVYELLGVTGSADPELQPRAGDEARSRLTAAAFALLDQGRVADAVAAYESVLTAFPDDGLARAMRDVAAKAATGPAPDKSAFVPAA